VIGKQNTRFCIHPEVFSALLPDNDQRKIDIMTRWLDFRGVVSTSQYSNRGWGGIYHSRIFALVTSYTLKAAVINEKRLHHV
jgi:hypothetical protein